MYEQLDQLVNIDYNKRNIYELYLAAREYAGSSLTWKAAEMIENIPAGRFVFLATGALARGWVSPTIGETDGPLGTAILAKVIQKCRTVIPIILTEESLVDTIEPVLKAAGLRVVTPEQARRAQEMSVKGYTSVACILAFPSEDDKARKAAQSLIAEMNPAALFCIEKAGRNEKGIYHNMRGHNYSQNKARIDFLVEEARIKEIPTLGIGDGGNEIGMGCIIDAVKKHVPYGETCQCGCSQGIASTTETDLLVTAAVSNWGCYAICAALALKNKNIELLPSVEDERRMLNEAIIWGNVDGVTGKAEPTVDGFSLEANCGIIEMLSTIVQKELGYSGC